MKIYILRAENGQVRVLAAAPWDALCHRCWRGCAGGLSPQGGAELLLLAGDQRTPVMVQAPGYGQGGMPRVLTLG